MLQILAKRMQGVPGQKQSITPCICVLIGAVVRLVNAAAEQVPHVLCHSTTILAGIP